MLFYSEIHITAQRCLVSGFFLLSQIFFYTAETPDRQQLFCKKNYAKYAEEKEMNNMLLMLGR